MASETIGLFEQYFWAAPLLIALLGLLNGFSPAQYFPSLMVLSKTEGESKNAKLQAFFWHFGIQAVANLATFWILLTLRKRFLPAPLTVAAAVFVALLWMAVKERWMHRWVFLRKRNVNKVQTFLAGALFASFSPIAVVLSLKMFSVQPLLAARIFAWTTLASSGLALAWRSKELWDDTVLMHSGEGTHLSWARAATLMAFCGAILVI